MEFPFKSGTIAGGRSKEIQQLRQDLALSKVLAIKFLKDGMMKNLPRKKIAKNIEIFLLPIRTLEHGRPIYREEAEKCGISIKNIDIDNPLWKTIWELHLRYDYVLNREFGKIVESVSDYYGVPGHMHAHHEMSRETKHEKN